MSREKALKKQAKRALEEWKFVARRAKKKNLPPEKIEEAEQQAIVIAQALHDKDYDTLEKTVPALESNFDRNFTNLRPNAVWESVKAFSLALLVAFIIRWFIIEPFHIPSGSMVPTLLIGDQLLVNKMVYGPDYYTILVDPDLTEPNLSALKQEGQLKWHWRLFGHDLYWQAKKLWLRRIPKRGEIVVFRFPGEGPKEDYIKRIVGLPGDKIELKEGRLYINDVIQPEVLVGPYTGPDKDDYCREFNLYDETLIREDGTEVTHPVLHCNDSINIYWNYGPVIVPEGMLFGMGDNRDRSSDSRAWGFIPVSHLKGRAMIIHLPLNPEKYYTPRWGRFFKPIR